MTCIILGIRLRGSSVLVPSIPSICYHNNNFHAKDHFIKVIIANSRVSNNINVFIVVIFLLDIVCRHFILK